MKSKRAIINLNEDEEVEDDAMFDEEEARMKAAQLEREIEEQNKFDCLCDGVNNCLSLVDSSFSELLDLKDELLQHELPPSLLVAITLVTGKMFRSITDLHTPIQELTRLVNIYSIPWEQRSEALKKLHTDYESKQRQLNIAIRRLQLIDAHTRRLDMEKRIMNWEKAFAKVTSSKTHGRRWKFLIEAFKKKLKDGVNLHELDVELSDDESELDQDEPEHIVDDGVSEKQRFMLSVIAASPPADEDGTPQAGSDIESEADGIPSEISDSTGNVDDGSPDVKQRKRGVSFGPESDEPEIREVIREVVVKPPSEDKSVWTHEPEFDQHLVVRIFRPVELKDDEGLDLSCNVSFGGINKKTSTLASSSAHHTPQTVEQAVQAEEAEVELKSQGKLGGKSGRRKSIGFAKSPSSPAVPSSPSKAATKPSSILKKVKVDDEPSDALNINRSKYQEVMFDVGDKTDALRISIHQGEQAKMIAMATITWDEIQEKKFRIKLNEDIPPPQYKEETTNNETGKTESDERDELTFEDRLANDELLMLPLQGIKLGIGGHSHGVLGQLPVLCYWVMNEKMRYSDVQVNTDGLRELVHDVTGVDMNEITKDELVKMLSREYNDVCTSAMSFVSSSSHKSGFIPVEEIEVIREQHDLELKNIQDEYEVKVQQLLVEVERLQTSQTQMFVHSAIDGESRYETDKVDHKHQKLPGIPRPPSSEGRPHSPSSHWRPPKIPQLPDWGAHLPKNVWVRMRMLTEEMIIKRQQLDARIRSRIASNIEKKLASQYKLQRSEKNFHGPLQDVSLPALFMPSKGGNVYNPRAHQYFHPTGTSGELRLTQPPSIFQLPPLPEKAKLSVVNLFELSKNFQHPATADWLTRIASAPSRGSRATTAGSRVTPHTPAPTANIQPSDVC
ncbi:uncharacterized protein LOC100180644 [Ciona intestinalis]